MTRATSVYNNNYMQRNYDTANYQTANGEVFHILLNKSRSSTNLRSTCCNVALS